MFAGLLRRYATFAVPGLGMFCEAYIIFSVGLLAPFQEAIFPACFVAHTAPGCTPVLMKQHVGTYIQIGGIMLGMLCMGLAADVVGRKLGSRLVAAVMFSGVVMLTLSPFTDTPSGYFTFFLFAQTWYGLGVGGEYPLASSSAAESAEAQGWGRGRKVVLVFSNQGVGNLANGLVLLACMAMFGQTGPELTPLGAQQCLAVMYAVAAAVSGAMLLYRALCLEDTTAYAVEAAPPSQSGRTGLLRNEPRRSAATASVLSNTMLAMSTYWPRQLAASIGWFANDFAFYGNKVGLFMCFVWSLVLCMWLFGLTLYSVLTSATTLPHAALARNVHRDALPHRLAVPTRAIRRPQQRRGPHGVLHCRPAHRQGAPLARLDMLSLALQALISRHTNPFLPPCSSTRCAIGPPGNASSVWNVPHIQPPPPTAPPLLPSTRCGACCCPILGPPSL